MEESDDSSSDFSTKRLQELLESMYDDLTDAAILAKKIYYASKVPNDYFTYPFRLNDKARRFFGVKRLSLESIVNQWLPRWKQEGRLNANGSQIRLGEVEAHLLGFESEEVVNVYELCGRLGEFFIDEPSKN